MIVLDPIAALLLDRMSVVARATREGHTNITRNAVTILAELRGGLATVSPKAARRFAVTFS